MCVADITVTGGIPSADTIDTMNLWSSNWWSHTKRHFATQNHQNNFKSSKRKKYWHRVPALPLSTSTFHLHTHSRKLDTNIHTYTCACVNILYGNLFVAALNSWFLFYRPLAHKTSTDPIPHIPSTVVPCPWISLHMNGRDEKGAKNG